MLRGVTDAETCRLNGWKVGTVLTGDEGYGLERILITAVGENGLLARQLTNTKGEPIQARECNWSLACREWVEA